MTDLHPLSVSTHVHQPGLCVSGKALWGHRWMWPALHSRKSWLHPANCSHEHGCSEHPATYSFKYSIKLIPREKSLHTELMGQGELAAYILGLSLNCSPVRFPLAEHTNSLPPSLTAEFNFVYNEQMISIPLCSLISIMSTYLQSTGTFLLGQRG